MTKTILHIFFFTMSFACFSQGTDNQVVFFHEEYEVIDTIIERNNPSALDLSVHQLFIDTSRTYPFYDRIEKWNPIETNDQDWLDYVYGQFEDSIFQRFDFGSFPRKWLILNKYQGDFILYKRCDGNHPSYEFNDSLFFIIGVHEGDCRKIVRVLNQENKEIIIELGLFASEDFKERMSFSFISTERYDVYVMLFQIEDNIYSYYVTPKEYVRNFDALVNHCPTNKVIEFDEVLDDY